MGLGFTIDTPLKVAPFGISSVISVAEDDLVERMREVVCRDENLHFVPIEKHIEDFRAKRITAYLNLLDFLVERKFNTIQSGLMVEGTASEKYFLMLPDDSSIKQKFINLPVLSGTERSIAIKELREAMRVGSIDVNIMTKVDGVMYNESGEAQSSEFSSALSALRGYANSNLDSSIVFSAGLNPKLFSYCTQFKDFFPDATGKLKKRIILKVSDFRSASIQSRYLAKKGLWVSEFRIESGINCGGHAFVAEGHLLGPILEEFKLNRNALRKELLQVCNQTLRLNGLSEFKSLPFQKITAQGGIGTYLENEFLINHYELDATGWGSPFLLVPEATNVDDETLEKLLAAKKEDYYLSHASPLGVPFHNLRTSSSEAQRKQRIKKNRAGSPCYKKFLAFNTEFTERPICTASREYQNLKIKQLRQEFSDELMYRQEVEKVTEKDCLCEGLGASALLKNKAKLSHKLRAVTICPGPNLAYFSKKVSLKNMFDHIYGRSSVLNSSYRPHMFVNELKLYVDYFKNEMLNAGEEITDKKRNATELFKANLLKGIEYYKQISKDICVSGSASYTNLLKQLSDIKAELQGEINANGVSL
jgi:hypothetical protein